MRYTITHLDYVQPLTWITGIIPNATKWVSFEKRHLKVRMWVRVWRRSEEILHGLTPG